MRRLAAVSFVAFFLAGCGPSPEVIKYREQLSTYLDATESAVIAIRTASSADSIARHRKELADHYGRLTPLPSTLDTTGFAKKHLELIQNNVRLMEDAATTRDQLRKASQDSAVKDLENEMEAMLANIQKSVSAVRQLTGTPEPSR